jgi:hypothetical protein
MRQSSEIEEKNGETTNFVSGAPSDFRDAMGVRI